MVDNNNTVSVTMDVLRQDTRDNTSSSTRGSNCRTPSKVAFEVPGLTSCEPDIDGKYTFLRLLELNIPENTVEGHIGRNYVTPKHVLNGGIHR